MLVPPYSSSPLDSTTPLPIPAPLPAHDELLNDEDISSAASPTSEDAADDAESDAEHETGRAVPQSADSIEFIGEVLEPFSTVCKE